MLDWIRYTVLSNFYLLITLILSYLLFYNNEKKLFILAALIVFLGWAYPPQGFLFSTIITELPGI